MCFGRLVHHQSSTFQRLGEMSFLCRVSRLSFRDKVGNLVIGKDLRVGLLLHHISLGRS